MARRAAAVVAGLWTLCAGSVAHGAPEGEIVREEAFNYRIVGKLPDGWKRRENELVWVYSIDKIPHAYIHLVRQRLDKSVDAAAELKTRARHYRFPGMPGSDEGKFDRAPWGGDLAASFTLETKHKGVACRRIVRARCAGAVWYEQIETVYGDADKLDSRCSGGLAAFRRGFRLLAPPVRAADLGSTTAATIESADGGFSLRKPEGFARTTVDPAKQRGIRLSLRAEAADKRRFVLVRLFEYGRYPRFAAEQWLNSFFTGFSTEHDGAKREPAPRPEIAGATEVHATVFTGLRDKTSRRVRVILCRTKAGRVFVLRITSSRGADADFGTKLHELLNSVKLRD